MRHGLALIALAALPALASCGTTTTTTVTKSAPPPVNTFSSTSTPTTVSTSSNTTTTTPTTTGGVTTSTSTGGGGVLFQGVAGAARQRPATLELTGDGTLYVSGVQWSSWGSDPATGTGIAHYHGCTPNCAQAPVTDALVTIRMSVIRTCSGRQFYSGVTLRLNSGQLLDKSFLQRAWSPC